MENCYFLVIVSTDASHFDVVLLLSVLLFVVRVILLTSSELGVIPDFLFGAIALQCTIGSAREVTYH